MATGTSFVGSSGKVDMKRLFLDGWGIRSDVINADEVQLR
jgi:hypothetical protein